MMGQTGGARCRIRIKIGEGVTKDDTDCHGYKNGNIWMLGR